MRSSTRAVLFTGAAALLITACIDFDGAITDCQEAGGCAAGTIDGGVTTDAGSTNDSGHLSSDAGQGDGGKTEDAGTEDAGTSDAGADAGSWALYSIGPSAEFDMNSGVWAAGPDKAYGVGWGAYVYQWNGTGWTGVRTHTIGNDWNAVWGYGDVVIVGGGNASWSRREANIWSEETSAPRRFFWIHGLADGGSIHAAMEGPAVGVLNGDTWSVVWDGGTSTAAATGVFVIAENDIWVCGTNGLLLHYDGTWNPISLGNGGSTLFRVWASGPNDVWVVGQFGQVHHFNGNNWSRRDYGSTDLRGVWGTGPNQVWVAGLDGTLAEWANGEWTPIAVEGAPDFRGLWGGGANDLFMSGFLADGGQGLLHYRR